MLDNPWIEISGRRIGQNYTPLVIAEIGINHDGSLKTAKEMVDAAFLAGAEIIKHQTHIVEDEMSHIAKSVKPEHADSSIYEIMERCSLSEVEENELKQYVESKGMIFISTPFSRAAADRLERMGVVAYKIGSGEMNNLPLISHIASFKKPLIVSTGMNDISSVRNTVELLRRYNIQFALLHTTNLYPTPSELVRLGAMQELMREFPDLVVGLSDHTINNNACLAATALGASILERHFTDSKKRSGPDISCSMDPNELRELINSSNEVFKMRGGNKIPVLEEKATMDFAFSTVVTIKDVNEGEIFDMSNIWVKRPGIGEIPADQYEYIIGKKAKKFLPKDIHLTRNDIEK
jgi:sialic acid synthase SpsE